jgi:hypothetical protein
MAKIIAVELQKIPKYINVGDDVNDIIVLTKILFHDFDIKLEMPYCLHVFVYDIHGDVDAPLMLPNWDESILMPVTTDRKDDFLGKEVVMLTATNSEVSIETPMALKLGQFNREMSFTTRKLEVFATIAPVISRASKYSEPFTTTLSY